MNKLQLFVGATSTLLLGCGSDLGTTAPDGTGSAVAAIAVVPSGVQCVRMSFRGAATNYAVAPDSASVLSLGPLAPGSLLLAATAYNVACAGVTASTPADWISDPVTTTVSAGLTTHLVIALRPNVPADVTVDFVLPVTQIAMGDYNGYALMADGTVRAWGANFASALGMGFVGNASTPAPVPGLTGVRQIAASRVTACALLTGGQVSCWGDNTYGQYGNGTTISNGSPQHVSLPPGVSAVQIAVGSTSVCAVATDATVWCWGNNDYGQLGDGTTNSSSSPVRVISGGGPLFDNLDVRVGTYHACARNRSLRLNCWGANVIGAFGDGLINDTSALPVTPTQFTVVRAFSISQRDTCAVGVDGLVRCAGGNYNGDIGDGSLTTRPDPTLVVGLQGATAIATGPLHSCATLADGTAWCWGYNGNGELGDLSATQRTTPVRVSGLTNAVESAVGFQSSCARLRDGTVWCWGANNYGQLGDGTNTDGYAPVRVGL